MMKTFTEKKFAEWNEDEIATTLRYKSESSGMGAKCLSYAVDMYNGLLTGDVTMVLTAARMDCHKIPCVILIYEKDDPEF